MKGFYTDRVNKPSGFEPLKFYCSVLVSRGAGGWADDNIIHLLIDNLLLLLTFLNLLHPEMPKLHEPSLE